jgi:predicted transcriptional regulator
MYTRLDRFSEQLASAVSEGNSEQLAQLLEAQKDFVTKHLELLDDTSRRRIQNDIERILLLAKASRAHCLDAILVNQRKLGVLSAYQAG